ncbi:MAG: hypothetical protein PHQ23_13210 [Candidatus Wallbacteria bacterium]|nr:hypothetical protein [Candidatus Wallbacteria bacterium]
MLYAYLEDLADSRIIERRWHEPSIPLEEYLEMRKTRCSANRRVKQ